MMPIPILTYHSMRIDGNAYEQNDLVALASDLRTISSSGRRIEPLTRIVQAFLASDIAFFEKPIVGLSCDDAPDFDFHDLCHPVAGWQRSVLNTLRDHAMHFGEKPHITSFAIVSPTARKALDRSCMVGQGWWTEAWWRHAIDSGFMHVANHSWDHNHDALPASFGAGSRGNFSSVDDEPTAEYQISQSTRYLQARAPNPGVALVAYPYGESNEYLRERYLPDRAEALGLTAAFGTRPEPMTLGSQRWDLPRFVFGRDWTTPDGLRRILGA